MPRGWPFLWDAAAIQLGLNFILTTDVGDVNALGEVTGGGSYEALLPSSTVIRAFGVEWRLLGLDRLIEVKRAAGRPRDSRSSPNWRRSRPQRELGAA